MEGRLATDEDGTYRDTTLERLRSEAATLKVRLDKGLPPDEYAALAQVVLALEAAASTVQRVWQRLHRKN